MATELTISLIFVSNDKKNLLHIAIVAHGKLFGLSFFFYVISIMKTSFEFMCIRIFCHCHQFVSIDIACWVLLAIWMVAQICIFSFVLCIFGQLQFFSRRLSTKPWCQIFDNTTGFCELFVIIEKQSTIATITTITSEVIQCIQKANI